MKQPTQADVARLAGVSRATVSHVINGKDAQGFPISNETRQRVFEAVARLGYVINARAQALRSGDTRTIGVMLPIYENPFFWEILKGICEEAREAGYSVLLADSAHDTEESNQIIRELAEQRIDGLLLLIEFGSLSAQIMEQLRNAPQPIVGLSAALSEFEYVHQGYGEGTTAIMSHLFELGHRRIGFVQGVKEAHQAIDRQNAYVKWFEDADLPFDESWIYRCGHTAKDGYQAAIHLLQQPDRPTALVVVNDLLAMSVIRAAADLGLKVPDDLSVASFDDILFADLFIPRLTTVGGDPEQNGRNAVRLLLKRLKLPERDREVIHAGWRLHIRESTGPAPG